MVNFKIYDVTQTGQQKICTQITYISRTKGNQKMKFAQLIEYNTRNIFFEKSYRKWDGKTIPRFFYTKTKLCKSLE